MQNLTLKTLVQGFSKQFHSTEEGNFLIFNLHMYEKNTNLILQERSA